MFHNLAYALEQLGRYDEARVALDEAVRRGGATDPRVQTSLGVVALRDRRSRRRRRGASSRRVRCSARKPPTPAWFHYAALTAALLGDCDARRAILGEGRRGASARRGAATTTSRRCSSVAATTTRRAAAAERGVHEDAGLAAAAQESRRPALSRRRATTRRSRRTCAPSKINPELGGDVYLKLGNIRFARQERDEAVRCWERALELDPDNAIVRTNLEAVRQVF